MKVIITLTILLSSFYSAAQGNKQLSREQEIDEIVTEYFLTKYKDSDLRDMTIIFSTVSTAPSKGAGVFLKISLEFDIYEDGEFYMRHYKYLWWDCKSKSYYYLSEIKKKYRPDEPYGGMLTSVRDSWHKAIDGKMSGRLMDLILSLDYINQWLKGKEMKEEVRYCHKGKNIL